MLNRWTAFYILIIGVTVAGMLGIAGWINLMLTIYSPTRFEFSWLILLTITGLVVGGLLSMQARQSLSNPPNIQIAALVAGVSGLIGAVAGFVIKSWSGSLIGLGSAILLGIIVYAIVKTFQQSVFVSSTVQPTPPIQIKSTPNALKSRTTGKTNFERVKENFKKEIEQIKLPFQILSYKVLSEIDNKLEVRFDVKYNNIEFKLYTYFNENYPHQAPIQIVIQLGIDKHTHEPIFLETYDDETFLKNWHIKYGMYEILDDAVNNVMVALD